MSADPIRDALAAGDAAGLPDGYQYGLDAMEAFDLGKRQAMAAVRGRLDRDLADRPMTAAERLMLDGHAEEIAGDFLRERLRQIETEGYSLKHDELHSAAMLIFGALAYCLSAAETLGGHGFAPEVLSTQALGFWLASDGTVEEFKRKAPRRDLERAGAMLIASVERVDRELVRDADHEAG